MQQSTLVLQHMLFSAKAIDFAYQKGTGLDNIPPGTGGVVLVLTFQ